MFGQKMIQLLAFATVLAAPAAATLSDVTEPVFGEVVVTNRSVYAIADRMFAEAERIWSSKNWIVISNSSGILNEGKAVRGVFAPAGVNITRATGIVDAPAQKLFDYLITPVGYQLIDPLSNPEDFSKDPLEKFSVANWRGTENADKKRLEVARTESVNEGIKTREFVVLNAIDASIRLFVSKSVQHKGDPGCSIYGPASCNAISTDPVRALNTFAVQVEPVEGDENKCLVQLINYADLTAPEIPSVVMNAIDAAFLPPMLDRMQAAFQ